MSLLKSISNLITPAINLREKISNKNIINGYSGIDASGKILESTLPNGLYRSSNRIYSSPSNGTALTTAALVANTLYAMPLLIERRTQINSIQINVTTSRASSFIRIGIYDDINLLPNNLILDAGQIASGTTGIKNYSTGLPLFFKSGVYWLVCVTNSNPAIRGFATAGLYPILGLDAAMGVTQGLGYQVNFTFAALPSTFPVGQTILVATPLPYIGVRT